MRIISSHDNTKKKLPEIKAEQEKHGYHEST